MYTAAEFSAMKADDANISDTNVVLYSILIFIWFKCLWETYLLLRQLGVYCDTSLKVPEVLVASVPVQVFEKIRQISIERSLYLIVKEFYVSILWTLIVSFRGLAIIWKASELITGYRGPRSDESISCNVIFMVLDDFFLTLAGCPLMYYKSFLDFENTDMAFLPYVVDQMKNFLFTQIIFIPATACGMFIIKQGGEYFYVLLWIFAFIAMVVMCMMSPIYIDPLIEAYRPLDDGPLRQAIENLAKSVEFPLEDIYIEDGEHGTAHSNAYLTGIFGFNRIVLYESILHARDAVDTDNYCDDEEILAIVCHELGHWKLMHIQIFMVLMQAILLIQVLVFAIVCQCQTLYKAIGVPDSQRPILVGYVAVLELVISPINTIVHFLFNIISKRMEYQADQYAKGRGFAEPLSRALVKLQSDSLIFPITDWMFSAWFFSHPTLLERLDKLKK